MSPERDEREVRLKRDRSDEGWDSGARVGQLLGDRYEIVRKIGEGGMGEVYEARHRVLGRRFAVKILHPELVRSARMLRRFSREALSASQLESDHVVGIVDCGHLTDGSPYYVMDYLRGRDLRQLLRASGPLEPSRAVRLLLDICHGLREAHESGLVHRDLKPENVFVELEDDGGERAKVLDFGVVQLGNGNSTERPGALVGTLKYMAPEQARGDTPVDQRADLYALGAILYECLSGNVPHPGRNTEEVFFHILNGSVEPLAGNLELPAGLARLVMRAIDRDPGRRFQTVDELARALLRIVRGAESTSPWHYGGGALNAAPPNATPLESKTLSEGLSVAPPNDLRLPTKRPPLRESPWRNRFRLLALATGVAIGVHFLERSLVNPPSSARLLAAPGESVGVAPAAVLPIALPSSSALPTQPSRLATESEAATERSAPSARRQPISRSVPLVSAKAAAKATPPPTRDSYGELFDQENPYLSAGRPAQ